MLGMSEPGLCRGGILLRIRRLGRDLEETLKKEAIRDILFPQRLFHAPKGGGRGKWNPNSLNFALHHIAHGVGIRHAATALHEVHDDLA